MNVKRLGTYILAAVFALCSFAFAESPEYAHYTAQELTEAGFQKQAATKDLELYVNRGEAIIAVRVLRTGYVWYSSPIDWDDDESASGFAKNTVGSLLSIRAKDARSTFRTANSIVNAVRRKGLTIEKRENGVRLQHNFVRDGISIPLDVYLDGASLVMSVQASGIVETPSEELQLQLLDFEIAPYFGSAPETEDGFILVPDGSGAVIRFNNARSSKSYSQYVYGRDPSIVPARKRNDFQTVALPVFGLSREGAGFIGILEDGKSRGIINAETAGQRTRYNKASSAFIVRDFDSVSFRERTGSPRDVRIFEKKDFETSEEVYSVRYLFLDEHENNLAGMANAYRTYLQEQNLFPKSAVNTSAQPSLVLNFIGSSKKKRTVAGLPVNVSIAYTTYDDIRAVVETLQNSGVQNFVVKIDGWTNEGVLGKYPSKAKASSAQGGRGDFTRLASWLSEQGIPFYVGVDSVSLFEPDLTHIKELTVNHMINRSPVKIPDYRLSTYTDEKTSDAYPYYILRAPNVETYFTKFLTSMKRFDQTIGLSPDTLGNVLSTDFGAKGTSREEARAIFAQLLEKTSGERPLGLSRPFDYALSGAQYITDLPITSSLFDIEDEVVPFYQMVLQGYIPYSNLPANRSMTLADYKLKVLETGADIAYLWITEHPDYVRDSRMQWFMDVYSEDWIEEAAHVYTELRPLLTRIGNSTIVQYEIEGSIRRTTFSNGTVVTVNYADKTYSLGNADTLEGR